MSARIIGVELRIQIDNLFLSAGPVGGVHVQRRDEVLLVPMNIRMPSADPGPPFFNGEWSMPCTIHTDQGDLDLGGQRYHLTGAGPRVSLEEYMEDLRRGVRL